MGVWDTVGALGIPLQGLACLTNRGHQFHDVELSGSVHNAYQALAVDERRGPFRPSLWMHKPKEGQTIEQVWFAGVHVDVGGGYREGGLSDLTFAWMKSKAEACGLVLDGAYVSTAAAPDPNGVLHNSRTGIYRVLPSHVRPIGDPGYANQSLHPGLLERYRSDDGYRPSNLVDYLKRMKRTETVATPL